MNQHKLLLYHQYNQFFYLNSEIIRILHITNTTTPTTSLHQIKHIHQEADSSAIAFDHSHMTYTTDI